MTSGRHPAGTGSSRSTGGQYEGRHRDGSLRARGRFVDGHPDGYWEWFRLDGTMLRSGWSERGRRTGERTTHDEAGAAYETTTVR